MTKTIQLSLPFGCERKRNVPQYLGIGIAGVFWIDSCQKSSFVVFGVQGTVVAITHDRYFLDNVAGWLPGLWRKTRFEIF